MELAQIWVKIRKYFYDESANERTDTKWHNVSP